VLLALFYLDLLEAVGAAEAPAQTLVTHRPPTGPVVLGRIGGPVTPPPMPIAAMSPSSTGRFPAVGAAPAAVMSPSNTGRFAAVGAAPAAAMPASNTGRFAAVGAAPAAAMPASNTGRFAAVVAPGSGPVPVAAMPANNTGRVATAMAPAPSGAVPMAPMPASNTARTLTPLPQLDPVELLTLAQRLFTKGDLVRAELAFETVARADSGNQRVRAFLIWIHFWKSSEAQRTAALELTVKTLRDVIRTEQTFALGHYFIGALAKLQKDMPKAEQSFRAALQHDPNLIEAQRELRLLTLRKTHR
jgi:hypothetical protein